MSPRNSRTQAQQELEFAWAWKEGSIAIEESGWLGSLRALLGFAGRDRLPRVDRVPAGEEGQPSAVEKGQDGEQQQDDLDWTPQYEDEPRRGPSAVTLAATHATAAGAGAAAVVAAMALLRALRRRRRGARSAPGASEAVWHSNPVASRESAGGARSAGGAPDAVTRKDQVGAPGGAAAAGKPSTPRGLAAAQHGGTAPPTPRALEA